MVNTPNNVVTPNTDSETPQYFEINAYPNPFSDKLTLKFLNDFLIVYKRYTRLNCHIFFIKNYTSYCKSYLCFVLNNTNRNIFCNKQKYLVGRKYKNRPHSKSHSNAPKLSRPVSFTILSLSGIAPMGKFTIANSKILLALKSLNDAESVSHTRIRQKK